MEGRRRQMKKKITFILGLFLLFFVIDFLIHPPKKPEPEIQNTGTQIISNPIVKNIQKNDYVKQSETPLYQSDIQKTNADPKKQIKQNSRTNLETNYLDFIGVWATDSEKNIEQNGGIVVHFLEFDPYTQIMDGVIKVVQDTQISYINFNTTVQNRVIYFEFDDDGYSNTGNGLIILNNNDLKISISTSMHDSLPNQLFLNGIFQLDRIQ